MGMAKTPIFRSLIAILLFASSVSPVWSQGAAARSGAGVRMGGGPVRTAPVPRLQAPLGSSLAPLKSLPGTAAPSLSAPLAAPAPLPQAPAPRPEAAPSPQLTGAAPDAAPDSLSPEVLAFVTEAGADADRVRGESARIMAAVFAPARGVQALPDLDAPGLAPMAEARTHAPGPAPSLPGSDPEKKTSDGKKAPEVPELPKPTFSNKPSRDFAQMFELTRRILTRPDARKFLKEAFAEELAVTEEDQKKYNLPEKVKDMSQSQFMLLLQYNSNLWPSLEQYLAEMEKKEEKYDPEDPKVKEAQAKWRTAFREYLKDPLLHEKFQKLNDPTRAMYLEWEGGKAGYSDVRVFANHQRIKEGKTEPPADLQQVFIDFLGRAKKKSMGNFFDFDLPKVAEAMIQAIERGVELKYGIDKNTYEERPAVKEVVDLVNKKKKGSIVLVDPVGLNHQKMAVNDWDDEAKAESLFSSGNLTQSCIGKEGDCVALGKAERPKNSVPNANHMVLMNGFLPAQTAANNLLLTLEYGLRGNEYPLGGAFKVFGGAAKGGKEAPYVVLAFSPRGGLGDINRDLIRRVVLETRGPIRMMQFAFSSQETVDALVERAKLEKKDGKPFDFKSVGDTPFAVRPWSGFLALTGMELDESKETKEYKTAKDAPLRKALGAEAHDAVKGDIRVGPPAYRNHNPKGPDGEPLRDAEGNAISFNAKIHHKTLMSAGVAIAGTSFNFSEAANSNNEQILVFKDPAVAAAMNEIFEGLFAMTKTSVEAETARRNELAKKGDKLDDDLDDIHDKNAEEGARKKK